MNWYYQNESGNILGPVSESTLTELGAVGAILAETQISADGKNNWISFADRPQVIQNEELEPISSSLESVTTDVSEVLMGHVNKIVPLVVVFLKRTFSSDFNGKMATSEEANLLKDVTSDNTLRNYLTWRRAVLMVGVLFFVISFCFGLPKFFNSFDNSGGSSEYGYASSNKTPAFLHFTNIVLQLTVVSAIYFMIKSYLGWVNFRNSRRLACLAALVLFVVPFVLYLIPVRWFISNSGYSIYSDAVLTAQIVGFTYALLLIPTVISIFPAFLRSSLVMKSVVPESTLPGWIALMIAPFNTLFFMIGLVLVMQLGNISGIFTFAALSVAPLFILLHVKKLIRPNTPEAVSNIVKTIRFCLTICYVIALIGVTWMVSSILDKDIALVINIVCAFVAKILIFNVVISDYLLGLIRFSYQEEEHLRGGELVESLRTRILATSKLG